MLRDERPSSLNTDAANPKEFAYARMQLMPLVEAALQGDWSNVKELLDRGYSLLWVDPENKKSAIKMIRDACAEMNIDGRSIVSKLCEYARAEYGQESDSYLFVLLETSDKSVASYVKLYNSTNGKRCSNDPWDESFPLTADGIFYLYVNDNYLRAHDLLKRAYNAKCAGKISNDQFEACVSGLMRAAALSYTNIDLIGEVGFCAKVFKNEPRYIFVKSAISAAASLYHCSWAECYIRQAVEDNDPMLDVYIGEAIIGAARGGRGDYVAELLELAKELNVSKSERFLDLLACASGAALVNDHIMLAKTLMLMVPHFKAKPIDIDELKKWPQHKVERMFATIRDYKMFTDIALHSCLVAGINTKAWTNALKKEYGLSGISDQGFKFLINQPKLITFLLKYKLGENEIENLTIDNETIKKHLNDNSPIHLSKEDIKVFMQALLQAREDGRKPNNHVPLYRLNFFAGTKEYTHYTQDEERVCLEIKKKITKLLGPPTKSRKNKTKVEHLHDALIEACTLQDLKHLLESQNGAYEKKKLAMPFMKQGQPEKTLLGKCVEIYKECLESLDSNKKVQYTIRT